MGATDARPAYALLIVHYHVIIYKFVTVRYNSSFDMQFYIMLILKYLSVLYYIRYTLVACLWYCYKFFKFNMESAQKVFNIIIRMYVLR